MEAAFVTIDRVKIEFKVVVIWNELGSFASFPQAFALFYSELNNAIVQGLAAGALDTCTIDCFMDDELIGPLMFDQIKELAEEMELLVEGKLADPIREFNPKQRAKFLVLLAVQLQASAEAFLAHIENIKARSEEWARNNPGAEEAEQEPPDQS